MKRRGPRPWPDNFGGEDEQRVPIWNGSTQISPEGQTESQKPFPENAHGDVVTSLLVFSPICSTDTY